MRQGGPGPTDNLRHAVSVLEDMEKYRNLHRGVAILCFFAAAGIGFGVFSLLLDLASMVVVSELVTSLIIAISWIMIFPVWVLAFAFILAVFDAMEIRDVRSVAESRLSNSDLGADELRELGDILASRKWTHGRIFRSVVADLTEGHPRR